ncbi:hypothetical protein ACYZX9_00430 [Sphingomonas citri]|jgi:hypothetical protein|uniref:Uncharacterized protein n=1 Tax=Sphingomonas citri TaxID=2862499 RepID=A0ABS7BJF3_9SPHN|nr:hypothetical protein [Sphingomonas citri]MBW6529755.1 hypothetical protein [Sphingomonas citri]
MQTERVTFLTTPEHKAALEAFAASSRQSVGHLLREASSRYLLDGEMDDGSRLELLVEELNDALPRIHASLDRSIDGLRETRDEINAMMRQAGLFG